MVKIKNVFGDEYRGKQKHMVYQKFYGRQIRRLWDGKKKNDAPQQREQQRRFRMGLSWYKSLSYEEKQGLKKFLNERGIGLTAQQYAIKTALDRGRARKEIFEKQAEDWVWREGWHAEGWLYRQKITLTNNNAYDLVDYQVKLELDSTKVGANFDWSRQGADLRFYDSNGNKLSYWVESWEEGRAVVWVKLSFIGANSSTDIFMYYGNSSAISESNAEEVFIRVIEGLVGAWHFDEGSGGTAYDSSGNNNHGTIYGATWTDGRYGKALKFDGTNDYVLVPSDSSLDIMEELTIVAWVMETGRGLSRKIVSRRRGWSFYFLGSADGRPYAGIGDGEDYVLIGKTFKMPMNEWHFLAFVYIDSQDIGYLYYDGELKETKTMQYSIGDLSGVALSIGAGKEGTDYHFKGIIDQVLIFNRALSDEEIRDLYDNFGYATPNCPGKVLVRKYAEIEPSAAFGAEEYGLTYTVTTISVEHVIIEHSAMQNVYILDENDEIIKQYTNLSNITDGEIATRLDFRNDTGKTVKKVIIESVSGVINTIIL